MMAVLLDAPLGIRLLWRSPAARLEARDRIRRQLIYPTERPRRPDDARRLLQAFHADPRRIERRPHRDGSVVREEPSIMTGQVGLEAVPQLRRPRGPVGHE